MSREKPRGTEYATEQDCKDMIRAKLTGAEFPAHVAGKQPHPMFTENEREILTEDIEKELAEEGYEKDENGIWEKKISSEN